MPETLAILYLTRKMIRSKDPIGTLLGLTHLEMLGLTALLTTGDTFSKWFLS